MPKIEKILKKQEDGTKKSIYPVTICQAIRDGKTGATLESLLSQFNSIYVQYNGTAFETRNLIPESIRRAGLVITYMNMDSETITERAVSASQADNDHWGLDVNWTRIDQFTLSGRITISSEGTWLVDGEDTGIKAVGPKGDTGLTPWLKTIDNKLHFSYDNVTWEPCSENIAAWFRFSATSSDSQGATIGRIQISRDNKTWTDLSPEFRNFLRIQGYVATTSALPKNQPVGTIYGVGPTYATDDTEQTNPIYRLHVWNGTSWVDNGQFTSIAAGVVQETGDSETEVMSQKAVTEKLSELGSIVEGGEYIRAYTDAEGKFIWGIKKDGSIEWAKGVPIPIREYVELNLESIDKLVTDLTNTFHYTSNEQWIHTICDNENRILIGIRPDGSFFFNGRDMYYDEKHSQWVKAIVDNEGRLLMGIKNDGDIVFGIGVPSEVKGYIANIINNLELPASSDNHEELSIENALFLMNQATFLGLKEGYASSPLTLLHCSDIHSNSISLKRIIDFKDKYKYYIDDVICTGDQVSGKVTDDFAFWQESGAESVLITNGNHDVASNGYGMTNGVYPPANREIVYQKQYAPFLEGHRSNGVVFAEGDKLMYYYKDYSAKDIRLISLDATYFDDDQISWLRNILTDAKDNGLQVIIMNHFPLENLDSIDCPFDSLLSHEWAESGYYLDYTYLNKVEKEVDEFIKSGGVFVCHLVGHTHFSVFAKSSVYPNQLCVAVPAASNSNAVNRWGDVPRANNEQDCFNIISIDSYNKILSIYRIGQSRDVHLRKQKTVTYDYVNMKLLYSE